MDVNAQKINAYKIIASALKMELVALNSVNAKIARIFKIGMITLSI